MKVYRKPQSAASGREEQQRREVRRALHQLQQLWGAQQHEPHAPDGHASKDALARDAGNAKGGAA